MTTQLFSENSYLFDAPAEIIGNGVDEKGSFLILNQTIFYPQGGGQPSDIGIIKCGGVSLNITNVRKDGDEIKHYTKEQRTDDLCGVDCVCILDNALRILHMRYHSAGHLLSNVAEQVYPEMVAAKAHCFPNEAYVEFLGINNCEQDAIAGAVKNSIESDLGISVFDIGRENFEREFYKLPHAVSFREQFRVVQIGKHKPIPCGGTHLASTAAIGNFKVTKIKNKNGNLRISFAID
jgi:alanyl-tRNA synthetase